MKAKFGSIVVDGRGKIGGHVASKNRGGSYFRTKVTPVNPQSTYQSAVRQRLASFSQAWGGLTQAQRDAWNAAVSSFKSTNIFGDLVNPSGFNLYCQLNANIANAGGTAITAPPTDMSVSTSPITAVVADASDSTITATLAASTPVGHILVWRATPIVSAGKSFVKNLYRQFKLQAGNSPSPLVASTEYEERFGSFPVAGSVIYFEFYYIRLATGMTSPRQRFRVVVGA